MKKQANARHILDRYRGKVAAVEPSQDSDRKRSIPKDHAFDPKSLKPMAKALWATTVSLGHALTAYRHFSRLKSTTISPDGFIGGRGYVMSVQDVRQKLFEASEALSAISDTLYDEISAPHWKPKLALLNENEVEDIEKFVEESKDILEHPDEQAEERIEEIESENDPQEGDEDSASDLPSGSEVSADPVRKIASSLPVDTLPGPRVDVIGPGVGEGPYGSFNPQEDLNSDLWGEGQDEYIYTSLWENDYREASSVLPSDDTDVEAWDFGVGFGANGQGAGGYENPSGEGDGSKGVYGPHSGLPTMGFEGVGDSNPIIESAISDKRAELWSLPNDQLGPAARSDYYLGDKGNQINAQSGLPGDSAQVEYSPGLPKKNTVHEDIQTPYVRYDYTTKQLNIRSARKPKVR